MRTFPSVLISVILSVAVSYALFGPRQTTATVTTETKTGSVYDRVTKSRTLRCGYMSWPSMVEKDPNTGKMQGLYVDMTEELAHGYGWKVQWMEEVPLSDFVTALNTDHIDMMCAPVTPTAQRNQWVYFSRAHIYAPMRAYVRVDDARFDNQSEKINSPEVRLATIEGEMTSIIARTIYPKAQVVEISSMQGQTQLFENIVAGKADAVFQEPFTFSDYNKNNPGKLRQVIGNDIGIFSGNYAIKIGEDKFLHIINLGIEELLNRGYIAKLAKDYHMLEAGLYLPSDDFKK